MKKILIGDWRDRIKEFEGTKFDLIFYDPPYGVTGESWDKPFSIEDETNLFEYLKEDGVIAVFGYGHLKQEIIRNYFWIDYYRYKWIWRKNRNGCWLNSKFKPTSKIEEIHIFSRGNISKNSEIKLRFNSDPIDNVLHYDSVSSKVKTHPCQKPIDLCKFIIETYTNEGDCVLDICSGSGSIPLAAMSLNRNFLGIENNEDFFKKSIERITKNKYHENN